MRQYDLFGNIVDTADERKQAYQLDEELTDLRDAMEADFDSKKFNPYLKEIKRNLHPVDFLNMSACSLEMIFAKNTDEIMECLKTEIYDYNKLFDTYIKWKTGGYKQ